MSDDQPIKVKLSWGSMWVIAWGIIMSGVVLAFLGTVITILLGIGFWGLPRVY